VTVNMSNHFVENGYKVSIVSLTAYKPTNLYKIDNRVRIDHLGITFETGFNFLNKVRSFFRVRNYFKRINSKIFLLCIGTYPALLAALIPKTELIKTVGCQHGSYSSVKNLWRLLRLMFYHRLDAVVCLTERDGVRLKRLNRNVNVIPNAVSFYPETPALLQNKIILSIGRIEYGKGYDLLLDVFESFSAQNNDWSLRIIGDGPLKSEIVSRINRLGLHNRIAILPTSDLIIEDYLNSSVYIMTSRTEGLPMVLLEAQACGLPILAFNCETGPAEIIHNDSDGFLIDLFDVDDMALKLQKLCSDVDTRKAFGRNARESVKRFFPVPIYTKWEELFNELRN
jgi:amylovoran biosynthesis glycosyltransferase AmsD